jgi:hypothetical protein
MERILYKEACRRSRLSRQRLMDSELSGQARAWRLWAVCNELTAGYSKSADRIHVRTLANMADMRDDKASPLLRHFDRLGVFIWRKDQGSRKTGFLALPSWVEPDADAGSSTKGQPKRSAPKAPPCPDHPGTELWLHERHSEDSAYVAKIVNADGTAWCCPQCTMEA